MFKSLSALIRGGTNDRMENLVDQNGVTILRQQIRDSANAIGAAKKAVAVAMAQNEQECSQHKKIELRLTDLEGRAIAAIEQGQTDLAHEAAETISMLEAERDTSIAAQKRFTDEIGRLKTAVRTSETRLRELQRGQRLAAANDKTQKMRGMVSNNGNSALKDAEHTLTRLQARQTEIDATSAAMDEINLSNNPGALSEKLAKAGCGAPIKTSADEVLERLSKKTKKPAA